MPTEPIGLPDPTPSELANVVYQLERLVIKEWRVLASPAQDEVMAKVAVMAVVYRLREDSDAARVLGIIQ